MDDQEATTSTPDGVEARSEQGLEILKHAFSEGGKVLEFKRGEDGMRVLDITEHHEKLQEHSDKTRGKMKENANGD